MVIDAGAHRQFIPGLINDSFKSADKSYESELSTENRD